MVDMIDVVLAYFAKHGICVDKTQVTAYHNKYAFRLDGPRNSVVIYQIWGTANKPIVDAWFGKANDDSGGLGLQGTIDSPTTSNEQIDRIIKLHKRFMLSGRRKVLRHFKAR